MIMHTTVIFIVFLSFLDGAFTAKQAANFVLETVSQRQDLLIYKRIATSSYYGLFGQNSKLQCSEVCFNEDSCESFYMEDGACVFGVSGDSAAFGEGEEANPDGAQNVFVKGLSQNCHGTIEIT